MLIDADWCTEGYVDWCWPLLNDADWCWLMLIDADWCWLMRIDNDCPLSRAVCWEVIEDRCVKESSRSIRQINFFFIHYFWQQNFIDTDWYADLYADRCLLMLIVYWLIRWLSRTEWLSQTDADWYWMMLTDANWCWLVLAGAYWCWLMLIDANW